MRSDLYTKYINKTKQIINTGRLAYGYGNKDDDFTAELNAMILKKGKQ